MHQSADASPEGGVVWYSIDMHIVVGSTSERKIAAVRRVVGEFFTRADDLTYAGTDVASGVPETPYDEQTYRGAKQRAVGAKRAAPRARLAVGLESGLVERYGHVYEEAWAVCIDAEGNEFAGYSSGLKVPDSVLAEMHARGKTHAEVMTILEEQHGQLPNDTWGSYSGGIIPRQTSLEEAIRNALVQVVAPDTSFYKRKAHH